MFLFAYITISEISISKFRNFKMWNFNILNFRIQTCHCFVVLIKITFAFSKLHGPTSILKYQKRTVATKIISYERYGEHPLPESCTMLFITLCTGWILKKRGIKIAFLQNAKIKHLENPYIFPP